MSGSTAPTPLAHIEHRILIIRGQRVMIDADLAALYDVPTKALNQAVKRNFQRFPPDFMFQLSAQEKQQVVTDCDHLAKLKVSRTLPFAFTEHGAIRLPMCSTPNGPPDMSVYVVRAFVRLRELVATHAELAKRLEELEDRMALMETQHDSFSRNTRVQLKEVVETLREMMTPPEPAKRPIGFVTPEDKPGKTKAKKQ